MTNSTDTLDHTPAWADPAKTETDVSVTFDGDPIIAYVKYVIEEGDFQAWIYRQDLHLPGDTVLGETELYVSIDRNEMISFTKTDHMREAARKMLIAADLIDGNLGDMDDGGTK